MSSIWVCYMNKFFKKLITYLLIREELDLKHRLANAVLLTLFLTQIPTILVTYIVRTDPLGLALQIALLLYILFMTFVVNRHLNSDIPINIFTSSTVLLIFPLLYFFGGGIGSGIVLWTLAGMVITWLMLKGWKCYFVYGLNILEFCALVYVEYTYPDMIYRLPSLESEMAETALALFFTSILIGVLLKYQVFSYEQQEERITRALAEVEKANNAKSYFLARVSHEIRTPINAVLGMDEMILKNGSADREILHYAANIDSAGRTLLSLINDILDISKMESGKLEIIPSQYDTFSLLNDCYNMVCIGAEDKGLELAIENNPELPAHLFGDEIRVRQILVNLLSNAVKYTRKGYVTLKVDFEKNDDKSVKLILAVMDTGIGISQENIGKLFNSFTRVDEKKNRNIEGTGLGLEIVHNLVNIMGGHINVTSQEGIGSTFVVELPQGYVSDETVSGLFSDRIQSNLSFSGIEECDFLSPEARVLVVDDVAMNLEVVEAMLKPLKVKTALATRGSECLELASKNKYDIILLDHMMPDLDGTETLERMRKDTEGLNANTPVIVLTANAVPGAKEEYIAAGFTDYLSKPVRSADLFRTLRCYLPSGLIEEKPTKPEYSVTHNDNSDILSKLGFLDIDEAVSNCAGSIDRFISIVRGVVTKNLIEEMQACFELADWKNYYIHMHGSKSSLKLIGCPELPDRAHELEEAARDMNIQFIMNNHDRFIADFRDLVTCLKNAVF